MIGRGSYRLVELEAQGPGSISMSFCHHKRTVGVYSLRLDRSERSAIDADLSLSGLPMTPKSASPGHLIEFGRYPTLQVATAVAVRYSSTVSARLYISSDASLPGSGFVVGGHRSRSEEWRRSRTFLPLVLVSSSPG